MPTNFRIAIVTPEAQILDEECSYASIPAHDGQLGVEHLRAPLLVKLGLGTLKVTTPHGDDHFYYIGGGFAQVKDDVLTILTEEAKRDKEIDKEEAKAALNEALAYQAPTPADQDRKQHDINRSRAMVAVAQKHR